MFVALTVATSSGPPSKGGVRCFSSSSRPTALNHGIAMHLKRQNGEGVRLKIFTRYYHSSLFLFEGPLILFLILSLFFFFNRISIYRFKRKIFSDLNLFFNSTIEVSQRCCYYVTLIQETRVSFYFQSNDVSVGASS